MRQYRALLSGQDASIAGLYWAGCIIDMYGFDLRQAQGPTGEVAEIGTASRLRSDNGEVAHDWALAGCGLILKSWVNVEPDLRGRRLVQVLREWRCDPAPVCALFPSGRQLPTRVRLFLDAMVDRLSRLGSGQPGSGP